MTFFHRAGELTVCESQLRVTIKIGDALLASRNIYGNPFELHLFRSSDNKDLHYPDFVNHIKDCMGWRKSVELCFPFVLLIQQNNI